MYPLDGHARRPRASGLATSRAGIATGAADDAHDDTASELHQALREAGAGSAELLGPLG